MTQEYYFILSGILIVVLIATQFLDILSVADADSGTPIFSIKNMISFVIGFSATMAFYFDNPSAHLYAGLVGATFMLLNFALLKAMTSLNEDGTANKEVAIGSFAEVTIKIPKANTGAGKISLVLASSFREVEAESADTEIISKGSKVKIVSLVNDVYRRRNRHLH